MGTRRRRRWEQGQVDRRRGRVWASKPRAPTIDAARMATKPRNCRRWRAAIGLC